MVEIAICRSVFNIGFLYYRLKTINELIQSSILATLGINCVY